MILVRKEDNLIMRYSDAIELDGNVIKVYNINFNKADITIETNIVPFEVINDVDLYTIYDVDMPAWDRYYYYIDGQFIEANLI